MPKSRPEGGNWLGPASNIGGLNGISNATGNTQLPLVAMFGSEADPFGQAAPAALPAWDAGNPVSQAPALYQVFFPLAQGNQVSLIYEIPMNEVVLDFFDPNLITFFIYDFDFDFDFNVLDVLVFLVFRDVLFFRDVFDFDNLLSILIILLFTALFFFVFL